MIYDVKSSRWRLPKPEGKGANLHENLGNKNNILSTMKPSNSLREGVCGNIPVI